MTWDQGWTNKVVVKTTEAEVLKPENWGDWMAAAFRGP